MKAAIKETDPTERAEGVPFVPSEQWIDEFDKQSTANGFEERLKRFARMRANMVAHAGRRVDDFYARELVQDAIDDTLEGVLAWDPARATLQHHLVSAIRSRTRHDYVQAQRFQHHSFDVASASPRLLADVESSLAAEATTTTLELSDATVRVLAAIRRIAANDADVLRLIDAYVQGATKKSDVMIVSGLTSKRYEAARKRQHRLVKQLPADVREPFRA